MTRTLCILAAGLTAMASTTAIAADLAPGTEVVVAPKSDLSSKRLRKGDLIDIVVANDVVQNGVVAIPRGTPGHGRVSWRTGRGGFGKSGKVEFEMVDLQTGNGFVPLSGRERIEGRGKTGLTAAAIVIGGVVSGAAIVGEDAEVDRGTRWAARTVLPMAITAPALPAYAEASAGVRLASVAAPASAYADGQAVARAALAAAGIEP